MEKNKEQTEYQSQIKEINRIEQTRSKIKQRRKDAEETQKIAHMLHKDTMYFLEELNEADKEGAAAGFLAEQIDQIKRDFHEAENNRRIADEEINQKLNALNQQEAQWEEKEQKRRREEEEQHGTKAKC